MFVARITAVILVRQHSTSENGVTNGDEYCYVRQGTAVLRVAPGRLPPALMPGTDEDDLSPALMPEKGAGGRLSPALSDRGEGADYARNVIYPAYAVLSRVPRRAAASRATLPASPVHWQHGRRAPCPRHGLALAHR